MKLSLKINKFKEFVKSRSKRTVIITSTLVAVLILAGGYYLYEQVIKTNSIKIGDTTISESDVDNYFADIEKYNKEFPDGSFQGDLKQQALDDLILNAAFKKEAKERNQPLTNDDLVLASGRETETSQEKEAYVKDLYTKSKFYQVRIENEAYKNKFADILLAKKDLLIISAPFDTPLHGTTSNEQAQKYYDEGVEKLKEIEPLVKSGASKEEIGKKADITLFDENTEDDFNSDPYFEKVVIQADFKKNFTPNDAFNDLDSTEYIKGNVGTLYATDEKINELKNTGDNTGIFASKLGAHMIVRLEAKNGGEYVSWTDFLDTYKKKYGDKLSSLNVNMQVGSKVRGTLDQALLGLSSVGLQKAQAQGNPSSECFVSEHRVRIQIRAVNVDTGNEIAGARVNMQQDWKGNNKNCPEVNDTKTTQAGGWQTFDLASCWNPIPTWTLQNDPGGFDRVGKWVDGQQVAGTGRFIESRVLGDEPYSMSGHDDRPEPNRNYPAGRNNSSQFATDKWGFPHDWNPFTANGQTIQITLRYRPATPPNNPPDCPLVPNSFFNDGGSRRKFDVNAGGAIPGDVNGGNPGDGWYDVRTAPHQRSAFRVTQSGGKFKVLRIFDQWNPRQEIGFSPDQRSDGPFSANYQKYIEDYPYDFHQTTVGFNVYYERQNWTHTGQKHPDWGEKNSNGNWRQGAFLRKYEVSKSWFEANESPAYKESDDAVADLSACRNRSFRPSVLNGSVNLNGSNENPESVTLNSTIGVDFDQLGPDKWMREPFKVNGLAYQAHYYVKRADNSTYTLGKTSNSASLNFSDGYGSSGYDSEGVNDSFTVSAPPMQAGDRVCYYYTINPNGTLVFPSGAIKASSGAASDSRSFHGGQDFCSGPVVDKPYLNVYGADVTAGSTFKDGETCSPSSDLRGIKAYRSTVANKGGSGVQFAALALGQITGFGSASQRTTAPTWATGLTFANSGVTTSGQIGLDEPNDGGSFGGPVICTTDFYGSKKDDLTAKTDSTLNSSQLENEKQTFYKPAAGTLTINGISGFNKKSAVFVEGDVIINGDISYDIGNYLAIVASGNIYIDKNVGRLDGIYIAQPRDTANGGNIYTCTIGNQQIVVNEIYNQCRKQLVINGAFVAKSVKFLRSLNSLRDSSLREAQSTSKAAEIFNFSPEVYLYSPSFDDSTTGQEYQYIITLPPVL